MSDLAGVVDGVKVFVEAINQRLYQDSDLTARMRDTISPSEARLLQEKGEQIIMMTLVDAAMGGCSEELLKEILAFSDFYTNIASRVISQQELAELVPSEIKNQATADILRSYDANNLADIYSFGNETAPEAQAVKKPIKPRRFTPK